MRAAATSLASIAGAAAITASAALSITTLGGPAGPSAASLDTAVDRELRRAVALLDDRSLGTHDRTSRYRQALAEADRLACRAILADPADPRAIERLAGIRWERSVFGDAPAGASLEALIAVASERAPRVPDVQLELGRTLYKMGRSDEASERMARAVRLSPSLTRRAVGAMIDAGVPPPTAAETLGRSSEAMIALKDTFLDSGRGGEFLDLVERDLADAGAPLLASYGEACLQLEAAARLRDRLAALSPIADPAIGAERIRQRAHASFALGDARAALDDAAAARRLMKDDPTYAEFFGEMALAGGQPSEAAAAFREALEGAVRSAASPAVRARIYREIGQALHADGRGDLAVDAFRHALALDPREPYALARVSALEAATAERGRR
ncbi:MAG TPA: hypothetical protein VFB67_01760 [Candidatus Polarisedimenticolaceae bacterium]|nr:hypothetical protein [Candidatus Polarisedimenticolaceae bacterium]